MNRRCGRVENIEVVRQRGNVDEPGQEHVRQFEQESIIPDVDNRRAKDLRIARVELALEKLELLHFHRVDLGFGRDAFGDRDMLGDGSDLAHVARERGAFGRVRPGRDARPRSA